MPGPFIKPWFQYSKPDEDEVAIASIAWGATLACSVMSAAQAVRQTRRSWRRLQKANGYIVLVWLEWMANVVMGIITFCLLRGIYDLSFAFLFTILSLWCFQVQCLFQIIINRIGFLVEPGRRMRLLRWGVFGFICALNISVFTIWIPAKLQINSTYMAINEVWDRVEKALICVVDLGLNLTFACLVRSQLIKFGLNKYKKLYYFNICMMSLSVSTDVLLIGMMSHPSPVLYLQFHGLIYIIKLQIEMTTADLLAKLVTAPTNTPPATNDALGSPFEVGGVGFGVGTPAGPLQEARLARAVSRPRARPDAVPTPASGDRDSELGVDLVELCRFTSSGNTTHSSPGTQAQAQAQAYDTALSVPNGGVSGRDGSVREPCTNHNSNKSLV